MGNGDTTDALSPLQPNIFGVTAIAGGFGHSLAIKDDGTVWSWGVNDQGQLGDGSTIEKHTPVQVLNIGVPHTLAAGLHHSLSP